jgi:hypothetical protein
VCLPKPDAWTAAKGPFDHIVSDMEHSWRHLDAKRSSRLQVDGGLEIDRFRDRKLSRLLTLRMRLALTPK